RRFTHRTHEEQQADNRQSSLFMQFITEEVQNNRLGTICRQVISGSCKNRRVIHRLEQNEHAENTQQKTEVTDAVNDKRFHRSCISRWPLEPETNQQIGCQTNAFPAKEHLHQIVRCDERQHRKSKERQIGKETRTV